MHQYDLHDISVKRKRLTGFRNGEEWRGGLFSLFLFILLPLPPAIFSFSWIFFFFLLALTSSLRVKMRWISVLLCFFPSLFSLYPIIRAHFAFCVAVCSVCIYFPARFFISSSKRSSFFPTSHFPFITPTLPPPQFSTSGCYFLCTSNRCHCFLYTSFWNVSRILKPDRPLRWKSVGGGGEGVALNVE